MIALRRDLVAALTACIEDPFRLEARRFLRGLSADELQFIAEFLGSSILEAQACPCQGTPLAQQISEFQDCACRGRRRTTDRNHKLLVLLEYLGRSGLRPAAKAAVAGSRGAS
jgi:hypothetical protein